MSPWLPEATVAVEDKRFYQHGGIDYVGIARALWADVSAGKVVEGGSTISQQLVRNMYTGREQTFDRKIKEACLAIKLSDKLVEGRILQTYLNTVYYGNHAYGVEAAAADVLLEAARRTSTLAQAALLAGLPQAPSVYDPLHNPKAALVRRERGAAGDARRATRSRAQQYRWAMRQPLRLKPGEHLHEHQAAVLLLVRDRRARERLRREHRARGRPARLHDDRAEAPGTTRTARSARRSNEPNDPAAAIVSVEPGTGAIRAMTAVIPGNTHNQFNLTSQSARQAGSTFKTFVLAVGDREGDRPRHDLLHLGARSRARPGPGARATTRPASPGRSHLRATPTPARSRSRARPCAPTTPSTRSSRSTSAPTTSGGWRSASAST